MENQQKKIFANCSQTVRNHCEFRNVLATSFALRNPIPQYTVALRNLPLTKPMRNFALPKFAVSSQTNFAMRKFRNAKFAMRISQCQFRNAKFNFAMPISISQCQIQFRNANFKFAMPIHCSFVSQSKPLRNFALRNSQPTLRKFANPFRIAKFTAFAKFTFTGLVILCN